MNFDPASTPNVSVVGNRFTKGMTNIAVGSRRRVTDGCQTVAPLSFAKDSGLPQRSTIGFAKIEFVWHVRAVAMRKNVIILGLLALGLAAGCLEKPGGKPVLPAGALVRAHFAGTDA